MTTLFSKTIDIDQPFQRLRSALLSWKLSTAHSENSEIGRLSCFIEFFESVHYILGVVHHNSTIVYIINLGVNA